MVHGKIALGNPEEMVVKTAGFPEVDLPMNPLCALQTRADAAAHCAPPFELPKGFLP